MRDRLDQGWLNIGRPEWIRRNRCKRGIEADTIDLQILHHTLDIVARFGKWDALNPVNRVDFGIAWIAMQRHRLFDPASPGVVGGKCQDVGAAIVLKQRSDFAGASWVL